MHNAFFRQRWDSEFCSLTMQLSHENSSFEMNFSVNCQGKLIDLSTPKVMGIINITPDSFYDGGN